ncbi:MAG TPA: tetratricopeptide repeat protein [Candidatus Handelsmanbacteria bacterium]|nr:tetratricopeptide repeat protein [Candidatus Handelsmanbacteria bacterium]
MRWLQPIQVFTRRWRSGGWLLATLGVFVVQNHCGVPGVRHDQLAAHFLDRGQHERALREARRAARETPEAPTPKVIAALALAGLGRTEEAAAAIEEALYLDPDDTRLYGTLRSVCVDAGREKLALEILQRLSSDNPTHWLLQLNLGWAHLAVGHQAEAVTLLEAAVAAADTTAPAEDLILAHFELSRVYAEQQRLDDASRVLESALQLAPRNPRLLVAAGEMCLQRRLLPEAEDFFKSALAVSPDVGSTAAQIARAFYDSDDRQRAILFYERSIAARPSPLTQNNLAWTYAEADRHLDRAQDLSLQAVKTDADNVVYLDTYAEVLFRRGYDDQAVAIIRRCLELEPADGEHYEYLHGQLRRFDIGSDPEL